MYAGEEDKRAQDGAAQAPHVFLRIERAEHAILVLDQLMGATGHPLDIHYNPITWICINVDQSLPRTFKL